MWRLPLVCIALTVGLVASPAWAQPSLTPESGPPGAMVTITGQGFGEFVSTETNRVRFNELPALVQRWEPDFIEVKVPHGAKSGAVTVTVERKDIVAGTFTVRAPHIEKLIPHEVVPGEVLQITGAHFGNTAGPKDPSMMFGVNTVLVGDKKALVKKWRHDKIEVVVPATAKSGEVVVRLASSDPLPNGFCCAPVKYTISNGAPVTILPSIRVDPMQGPVGTKVVLFGREFGAKQGSGDIVLLNGAPVTISQWTDSSIVIHVPLAAKTGRLMLKVKGKERDLGTFSVLQPKIAKVSPTTGPIGSLVRIRGENFGIYTESGSTPFSFLDFDPGANSVMIGDAPAIIYRWNDDLIDVWVPFSAKGGAIKVRRGGTVPNPDGSCCADQGVLELEAGSFTVTEPRVDSVTPVSAGIDEIVTIKGAGFGRLIKGRESTDPSLGTNAFLSKQIRLGENISRTEVLFNGIGALVVSWDDDEIKVRVPRRPLYGIGSTTDFQPDLSKGPLVVRRGSWDILPDGSCCTEKKWLTVEAGEFTILAEGLPSQSFFEDPNTSAQ